MSRLILTASALLAATCLTGCSDGFRDDCEARGGFVKTTTKTGTGVGMPVGGKGGPTVVVTTTELRFCIADGKVVDVQ